MSSQAESARANAAFVRESFDALNAGDTQRLLAVVAPDIVIHYAEMPEPLEEEPLDVILADAEAATVPPAHV